MIVVGVIINIVVVGVTFFVCIANINTVGIIACCRRRVTLSILGVTLIVVIGIFNVVAILDIIDTIVFLIISIIIIIIINACLGIIWFN